jgi:hypothetical protein
LIIVLQPYNSLTSARPCVGPGTTVTLCNAVPNGGRSVRAHSPQMSSTIELSSAALALATLRSASPSVFNATATGPNLGGLKESVHHMR